MKICADEHVAKGLVNILCDVAIQSECQLMHMTEIAAAGSSDVHWATKFANEGGHAILTADTDFLKRHHQVMAIYNTGLKVIHLPKHWNQATGEIRLAHILIWWKRIEMKLERMCEKECYKTIWDINLARDLEPYIIDFEKSRTVLSRKSK